MTMKDILFRWKIIWESYPDCLYPKYNIRLHSVSTYKRGVENKLYLESFVPSKDGKWVCLVADDFISQGQYEPSFLEVGLERFDERCKLIQENFIYNKLTAIKK